MATSLKEIEIPFKKTKKILQRKEFRQALEEKKLTDGALVKLVDEMTRDKASLMEMGAKARALAQPDSLQKIWTHLEHLLKTGKP